MFTTEDGKDVNPGDRVFNYYDRKWGQIASEESEIDGDWFIVHHDDRTTSFLNGERICSKEYAERRGW